MYFYIFIAEHHVVSKKIKTIGDLYSGQWSNMFDREKIDFLAQVPHNIVHAFAREGTKLQPNRLCKNDKRITFIEILNHHAILFRLKFSSTTILKLNREELWIETWLTFY